MGFEGKEGRGLLCVSIGACTERARTCFFLLVFSSLTQHLTVCLAYMNLCFSLCACLSQSACSTVERSLVMSKYLYIATRGGN